MATLAAPIATQFNSLPSLAWLATAFLIGQATAQPLCGKLTDIYSRRSGLIVSNILFGLGNLICGFAGREWTMILGRVIAGVGGGCLNSLATIITSDLIPLQRRGLWQGIGNVFWGIGNGLGGVVGGYFDDALHWRWAFLVQVPLTAISLAMMLSNFNQPLLKNSRATGGGSRFARIDLLGCILLIATMTSLLVGITAGGNIVSWDHPSVLVSLSLAAMFLCGFVYTEQKVAAEPILFLHYLKNRNILCGCLTLWLHHLTSYTMLYYIPIYYRVKGVPTSNAGAALIPFSVGFALASLVAGAVTLKTGRYRKLLRLLVLLMVVAPITVTFSGENSPLWLPLVGLGFLGFAISAVLTITWLAMTSAVEPQDQAVVTSLSYAFRSTGSVIGLAIASAVYQNVLENSLSARLAGFENEENLIYTVKHNLDAIIALPFDIQNIVKSCFYFALRATFLGATIASVLALVPGALIEETRFFRA
jgi:MFS family permease